MSSTLVYPTLPQPTCGAYKVFHLSLSYIATAYMYCYSLHVFTCKSPNLGIELLLQQKNMDIEEK